MSAWVAWYNDERPHSALDYVPPTEYEHVNWRRVWNKARKHPEQERSLRTPGHFTGPGRLPWQ
ncbi:hypothetical protein E1288_34350 [Saccharopolyspora elongata]|uniref:Integrase catalytic domain-containing protein n=1 Tax=Saccharopolyspora elongata TaxID=2530387 RepID=A0A4V2YK18_9PSEU|nr:hypothetical protein E1288_34350 [Saccharopolyspora elongata]